MATIGCGLLWRRQRLLIKPSMVGLLVHSPTTWMSEIRSGLRRTTRRLKEKVPVLKVRSMVPQCILAEHSAILFTFTVNPVSIPFLAYLLLVCHFPMQIICPLGGTSELTVAIWPHLLLIQKSQWEQAIANYWHLTLGQKPEDFRSFMPLPRFCCHLTWGERGELFQPVCSTRITKFILHQQPKLVYFLMNFDIYPLNSIQHMLPLIQRSLFNLVPYLSHLFIPLSPSQHHPLRQMKGRGSQWWYPYIMPAVVVSSSTYAPLFIHSLIILLDRWRGGGPPLSSLL